MSDFGYNRRRKHKPRERPTSFKDQRDLTKDSYDGERGSEPSPLTTKPPIILTKPENRTTPKQQSPITEGIKLQTGTLSATASPSSGTVSLASKNSTNYSSNPTDGYKSDTNYHPKSTQNIQSAFAEGKEKSSMKKTMKLIDGAMNWSDAALEELRDRPDFVVVGVIGMQGVGKSTIMSYLSGNQPTESFKKYTFPLQTNDIKERAGHMTNGVDFFITSDNFILLDAQPILSASVLEQNIYNERKYPGEYNNSNSMELQSLQIATFLFTVCHVVLVVQDWFTDPSIHNFLQTAEMLKLSPPSQDSLDSEYTDFYPHIVFIQNKAEESCFEPSQILLMNDTVCTLMQHSNLLYKGTFSLAKSQMFPWYNHTMLKKHEANLFLLPEYRYNRSEEKPLDNSDNETFNSDKHFIDLPDYKERPSFNMMSQTLKYMILSMPRIAITRYPLTDKTWFYHASKSWDSIKKSPLMSEYNRLLA